MSLGPLDADAIHRLTREVLGGEADDHIRRLLDDTRGSPFLIVELLLGLRDEQRVRVEGGRAELVDGCVPSRVRDRSRPPSPPRRARRVDSHRVAHGRSDVNAFLAETD